MNQVYLHMEEMQNFMNSMRDILNMPNNGNNSGSGTSGKKAGHSDAAVMSEIQRIVLASTRTSD